MSQQQLINITVPSVVNKTSIKTLADNIVSEAIENAEPLKVAEGVAVLEKLTKAIREDHRFVNAVVEATNRQHVTSNGTIIEVTEVGVKYDYSYDEEWADIQYRIDCLIEARKEREAVLKSARQGQEKVDESTGEVFIGANKSSKTSYKITLAK